MSKTSDGREDERQQEKEIRTSIRKLVKDNDLAGYLKQVRKVDMALQPQERKELKRYMSGLLAASGTAFAVGALAPVWYIRKRRMQNRRLLMADFIFGSFVVGFSSFWCGVMTLDIGLAAAPFFFGNNPRQREMATLIVPIPEVSEWQKYFKDTYEQPDLLNDWNKNFVDHFKVIKQEAVKQRIVPGGPVPERNSIKGNSWGDDDQESPKQEESDSTSSAWDRLRQSAGKKESAWDKVRNGGGLPPGPPMRATENNQQQPQQNDDDVLENLNLNQPYRSGSNGLPSSNPPSASKPKDAWGSIRESSNSGNQRTKNLDFMTPSEFEKDMELEREGESIDDFTETEKKYSS